MADHFKLTENKALQKALEIVTRDEKNVKQNDGQFDKETQVDFLVNSYTQIDPDTCFNYLSSLEKNEKMLAEEASFVLLKHQQYVKLKGGTPRNPNYADGDRFERLMTKYHLANNTGDGKPYDVAPIAISFPIEEYNVKMANPNICLSLPNDMGQYRNFKKEYDVDGICALLPAGQCYGGFVKAFLKLQLLALLKTHPQFKEYKDRLFHMVFAKHRTIYNSKIFPESKRLEWFDKLGISQEDCLLWTQLFDQQFPCYKDAHKFFGQAN